MIEGKFPIDLIALENITLNPSGWKLRYLYFNKKGESMAQIGEFNADITSLNISEESQNLLNSLLESLENDLYSHLFSTAPPEREVGEEPKEEKSFEETIGVRNPSNITLVDEYDM